MKNKKSELQKIRQNIDRIDAHLVWLLNERAKNVLKIKEIKTEGNIHFYAPHREMEVYRRVGQLNKGPFATTALEAIFCEIMSGSLALEAPLKIIYFGPIGSMTHMAAIQKFGTSSKYISGSTLKDVFLEVERGRAHYGVVPIENSTEGVVFHTLDLFVESDLRICSEILFPISHTLMSLSGNLKKIKKIYSHPYAFTQCRAWLESNLPGVQIIECATTPEAAQLAQKDALAAAIASDLAAKIYHLKPIAKGIEDIQENYTRYLVIGKTNAERTGKDKTSLMVSIRDRVGALFTLLKPFEKHGFNLTSIESRPFPQQEGGYHFFIDFQGHVGDLRTQRIIKEIEKLSLKVKVLGSYPRCEQ